MLNRSKKVRSVRTSPKAVIIRDGRLLVVVKRDGRDDEGPIYILPGGGQNHSERLELALRRECLEEIGTPIEIDRLLFVREYIGRNHRNAPTDSSVHIVDFIFACRVPDDYEAQMGTDPDDDQEGVTWLPLASLQEYRFFPQMLIPALQAPESSDIYLGDVN